MIYSLFQNIYQEQAFSTRLDNLKGIHDDIDICKLTVKAMDEVQQYHFQLEHEENLNKKKGGNEVKYVSIKQSDDLFF